MVSVDPSGLVSAAQRITAALSEFSEANPVHPPLGADPASVGAAGRLTTAGTTLASMLAEQAAGLVTTAEQLVSVAGGFVAKDEANATKIASLSTSSEGASVSGWAPPSPPVPPDARPILAAPPAIPAEVISNAVHSGDVSSGESFISGWRRVAGSARDASSVVRLVADNLPESWDSPVATEAVRSHLIKYADAFEASGQRAETVADQANRHAQELTQARSDIPTPEQFTAMNHQLQVLAQANAQTGGMYAVPLANGVEQKSQMEAQAAQGFGGYYSTTEATTAGEVDLDGDGIPDVPADEAAAAAEGAGLPGDPKPGEPGSPDMAGQLSSMLPSMIPTVLGAAGGLLGGAMSSVTKVPESLLQAGSQAVGAATQSLSGMMQPKLDDLGTEDLGIDDAAMDDMSGIGGGGGGGTSPAAGGAPSTPPVMPSTGPNPTPPTMPTGAGGSLPPPVAPVGRGGAGMMPMGGMPMMGGAPGGQGGGAEDRKAKPKQVVGRDIPHTESVTGRVSADRIAVSATAPDRKDEPPHDDDPPQRGSGSAPLIRRITTVRPTDGS
jgi:hypothetical protein